MEQNRQACLAAEKEGKRTGKYAIASTMLSVVREIIFRALPRSAFPSETFLRETGIFFHFGIAK